MTRNTLLLTCWSLVSLAATTPAADAPEFDGWIQSGVWDLGGEMLVRATRKNSVVVAEIDLSEQYFRRANMGEFKGRLRHERPAIELPK